MVTKSSLNGQRILITRPEQQSAQLAQLIEQSGGEAILFPVITIEKLPVSDWAMPEWSEINWLIFISRNAVASFVAGWKQDLPRDIKFAAVGAGTAQAMQESGIPVHCQPLTSSGTDGLLTMPEMQDVEGCKIVIIRGVGGRELLAQTLISRGAKIKYVEVYRRNRAVHDKTSQERALLADKLVCTSVTGLDNLTQILSNNIDVLLKKSLIVVSDRIKAHAESVGFSHVAVSADASDRAILQMLTEMDN
ncbi:uroporphyrinogen-III synthase [Methylophaga sp.]|uniref:uroporphyrinogen-III synthase n=1 Tax=Methylophaga sp. TaxID=2024840 RepID=UPI003F69BAF6